MIDLLLLSKNTPIAKIENGTIVPLLFARLPLFLQRTGDITAWLSSRAIDAHRTNSRLLKKVLRLEYKDDLSTVLSMNAATVTDNYWVKALDDTDTDYNDVRFSINYFDRLALTGDVNSFNQPPSRTPELTNIGSFEKCWRLTDGNWWLVKVGKPEELFSELLIARIGKLLGLPVAEYVPEDNFIKSLDFTNGAKVDFEPAVALIGEESNYINIYNILKPLGLQIVERYLQMCYLDALVFNMDRHEYNFGVLRDDVGNILTLAPFFDHNIALVSNGYPMIDVSVNDRLIEDFSELIRYVKIPFVVRALTHSQIVREIATVPWELPVTEEVPLPRQFVARYLINRQERIKEQNREWVRFQPDNNFDRASR